MGEMVPNTLEAVLIRKKKIIAVIESWELTRLDFWMILGFQVPRASFRINVVCVFLILTPK